MWSALRKLIVANPMGIFLWGIISKWYLIVAVSSIIVLYYVASGLKQIGFIDYVTTTLTEVLLTTKAVAQNCTPKLGPQYSDLVNYWDCLGNPPRYEVRSGTGETQLENAINKLLQNEPFPNSPTSNPYDQQADHNAANTETKQ